MKKIWLFIIILICSCSNKKNESKLIVSFTKNRQSIKFTGLDKTILGEIVRDSILDVWQNLMPVYKMPADTDSKDFQPAQPGSYRLADSVVIFTPDSPFNESYTYFMRFYKFGEGTSLMEYVKGKGKLKTKNYIDLIIK